MNRKEIFANMSYFRLSLVEFLRESFPELLQDEKFIAARTDAALDVYEQAVQNGEDPIEAEHSANDILFAGLYFSRHDTLKNILWNEFFNEIPQENAPALAIQLLPQCEDVFAKYPLSDDFACFPEYELLYTELTGAIALYLEGYGIQ